MFLETPLLPPPREGEEMTPPLNHHHSGAGLFRKEQDPNSSCLGCILFVAISVLILAAVLSLAAHLILA